MEMNETELQFWNSYLETLDELPVDPTIEISIAGNEEIADQLLNLYLSGKKSAGSGLVKDYELAGDEMPKVGNFWIILNSKKEPKCIVRTRKIEIHRFSDVPKEVAIAEGEGDLTLDYWKQAHLNFFTPYLEQWGITNIETEEVVTEFYDVVFK